MVRGSSSTKLQQSVSGPSESTTAKPKHTRLRESCNSCLAAKVKCTKTRPLCARCLSTGAPCGYSPSSRAGRHKSSVSINTSNANSNNASNATMNILETPESSTFPPVSYLPLSMYSDHPGQSFENSLFGCSTPLPKEDPRIRHSTQNSPPSRQEEDAFDPTFLPTNPMTGELMNAFLPLTTQSFYPEFITAASSPSPGTNSNQSRPEWAANINSYNLSPTFESQLDMTPIGHHPSSRTPSSALSNHQESVQSGMHMAAENKQSCDCFAICLQALSSLHNHSWSTSLMQHGGLPFDIVLTINREAIEGCSAMLGCSNCVSKGGSSTSTMLLATLIEKIMSLYRSASYFHFGSASSSQAKPQSSLAFGAYVITGEDKQMLEMEIFMLELRRVEMILERYQEKFGSADAEKEDNCVYSALASYLSKNLHFIFEYLRARKGV
ncbi:MAG: hypothetical protein M1827_003530 [Pycnora praestabilis]|nr:MAG: hypothetical protein M1827_003530 [Pycnora praestabilis]